MTRLRVLIATAEFYPQIGGVSLISDTLARGITELGGEVTLLTSVAAGGLSDSHLPYTVVRNRGPLHELRAIVAADLVVAMGPIGRIMALCAVIGRPFIVSHQIHPFVRGAPARLKWSLKRALLARGVEVACSAALARTISPREVGVVPNPLRWDFPLLPPDRPGRDGFLFCGRLIPEKGVDLLIRAFALLASNGSAGRLTIVGDGPEMAGLVRLARQLGTDDRVSFRGNLTGSGLLAEYERHEVLVVPSIWEEPFGIVALEGLAAGCRVVVTDRGGLPEAVGELGIVAAAEPEALSSAMLHARQLASQEISEREREALRAHLARHSTAAFARAILESAGMARQAGSERVS